MEKVTGRLEAILNYFHDLDNKGFKYITGTALPFTLVISDGYIPHGHHSESWNYSIDVHMTHLLTKQKQIYAVIEGTYSFWDTSEKEGSFPCVALLEIPDKEVKQEGLKLDEFFENIGKKEVRKSIKEFYEIVGNSIKERKEWWFET
jgi:hypothetical protein